MEHLGEEQGVPGIGGVEGAQHADGEVSAGGGDEEEGRQDIG